MNLRKNINIERRLNFNKIFYILRLQLFFIIFLSSNIFAGNFGDTDSLARRALRELERKLMDFLVSKRSKKPKDYERMDAFISILLDKAVPLQEANKLWILNAAVRGRLTEVVKRLLLLGMNANTTSMEAVGRKAHQIRKKRGFLLFDEVRRIYGPEELSDDRQEEFKKTFEQTCNEDLMWSRAADICILLKDAGVSFPGDPI